MGTVGQKSVRASQLVLVSLLGHAHSTRRGLVLLLGELFLLVEF